MVCYCIIVLYITRLILLLRAFIKAASPSDATAMENLERERRSYLLPRVASAACFRKLYDVFDNSMGGTGMCIALEWLDTTLAEVKYLPGALNYAIIQSFLRAALSSCIVLENQKFVNTGISISSRHVEIR